MPKYNEYFFSLSVPLRKSTVKNYMGIFELWETVWGWDQLLIVMIRPLELFQVIWSHIPLSMFENMPEAKVSQIAWKKIDLVVSKLAETVEFLLD